MWARLTAFVALLLATACDAFAVASSGVLRTPCVRRVDARQISLSAVRQVHKASARKPLQLLRSPCCDTHDKQRAYHADHVSFLRR